MIPNDLPPWAAVHQQAQRWIKAGCFEVMAQDLRKLLRMLAERKAHPTAVILDGRTLQSTPESGERAGYDGYKRKNGLKVHIAVDTLGHLLALKVTPANEQERAQVADLITDVHRPVRNRRRLHPRQLYLSPGRRRLPHARTAPPRLRQIRATPAHIPPGGRGTRCRCLLR